MCVLGDGFIITALLGRMESKVFGFFFSHYIRLLNIFNAFAVEISFPLLLSFFSR